MDAKEIRKFSSLPGSAHPDIDRTAIIVSTSALQGDKSKGYFFIHLKVNRIVEECSIPAPLLCSQVELRPKLDNIQHSVQKKHILGVEVCEVATSAPEVMKQKFMKDDVILRINGITLKGQPFAKCVELFQKAFLKDDVVLYIERKLPTVDGSEGNNNVPNSSTDTEPKLEMELSPKSGHFGEECTVCLCKSPTEGFGFSLTHRDNATTLSHSSPVFIKKINSSGAALRNGQLRMGDRLLHFHRKDQPDHLYKCDAMSFHDICHTLRLIPPHVEVLFTISRQPSKYAADNSNALVGKVSSNCVTVELSLLSAQELWGIDFQWNVDHISIKHIVPEFAAARSNLLQVGDRVVQVNDIRLDGLPTKSECFMALKSARESQIALKQCTSRFVVQRANPTECTTADVSSLELVTATATDSASSSRPKSCIFEFSDAFYSDNCDSQDQRRSSFVRDGVGRRSMSSKHNCVDDARNFQFYQDLMKEKGYSTEMNRKTDCYKSMPASMNRMRKIQERVSRMNKADGNNWSIKRAGPVHDRLRPVVASHSILDKQDLDPPSPPPAMSVGHLNSSMDLGVVDSPQLKEKKLSSGSFAQLFPRFKRRPNSKSDYSSSAENESHSGKAVTELSCRNATHTMPQRDSITTSADPADSRTLRLSNSDHSLVRTKEEQPVAGKFDKSLLHHFTKSKRDENKLSRVMTRFTSQFID